MTSENTSDNLNLGRGWLNRAAEMLDSCEDHVSDAEFARAAAAIGNGFIQLAAAQQWAVARAEDVERQAARQAEEAPLTAAMVDAHQLAAELAQRQLDAINAAEESGGGLVATLRSREKRTEAEVRPHDDEQPRGEAAYLLEGDDEVATPLPFLGFTQDGYPVGGPVPADVQAPALVARCGGLAACGACERDALRLQREAGRG